MTSFNVEINEVILFRELLVLVVLNHHAVRKVVWKSIVQTASVDQANVHRDHIALFLPIPAHHVLLLPVLIQME